MQEVWTESTRDGTNCSHWNRFVQVFWNCSILIYLLQERFRSHFSWSSTKIKMYIHSKMLHFQNRSGAAVLLYRNCAEIFSIDWLSYISTFARFRSDETSQRKRKCFQRDVYTDRTKRKPILSQFIKFVQDWYRINEGPNAYLTFGMDHKRSPNVPTFFIWTFLSDEGPTLETLDFTIRIGSTPTFSYFDLYLSRYLYSAYVAHYV